MSSFKGTDNQGLLCTKRLSLNDNKYAVFILKNRDTEWSTQEKESSNPTFFLFLQQIFSKILSTPHLDLLECKG